MHRLATVLLILLGTTMAAAEKPRLPNTAVGKRAAALLAAFNSGDATRIRGFVEENYAASALKERLAGERAAVYLQLYGETEGLKLRRVQQAADTAVTFLAETRSAGEWYEITCQAEADSQHHLLGAIFRLTPRPAEFRPKGRLTDQQIAVQLQAFVEKLANSGWFSGVIIYADRGQPVWQQAFPRRRPGAQTDNYKLNDRFGLASINKMFVAVAIAQLAEQGKLAFSDHIARYLPEYPRERGEKITIQQLLTHTAGLDPMLEAQAFEEMRRAGVRTRADEVRFLGRRPIAAAPGEKFLYSNGDYMLLEAIAESVTHQSFEEYARAHIFVPLGMSSTGHGASTAPDLLRFTEGLRNGKLLSAKSFAVMMTPQVRTDAPQIGYGHGMEIQTIDGTRVVGHSGRNASVSAQLDIYPDDGSTVIILSEQPGDSAARVANRARELITQR